MDKMRILIVEDEIKIARFIQLELEHEGYLVLLEHDGRAALDKMLSESYDLIILDIMLPSLNGIEVLRRFRQVFETPVIMLTARDEIMDKVMGLDSGADDYMIKPFAIEELLARIRRAFKHKNTSKDNTNMLQSGALQLNLLKHTVVYATEAINLTKTEFDLLKYLMQNLDITLTRDTILEKVWGYEYGGDTNVVDVYIRYLRSKIDEKYDTKFIHTVRGVGYQFRNEK
ncbi:MAG: DNA-binding response regulator [Firmicutes bacterium HGW-Firmicutes-12]|jgi:DNA-binding response OmpR family regulator|nr:MAG: DNA-binding response regulator [Firmicutes bacterium HGW-Firmicutes-12]